MSNIINPHRFAAAGYALDGSNDVTVTPVAHWDASKMTGSDNTGWDDEDTVSEATEYLWQDRTGEFAMRGPATAADQPIFVASHSLLNDLPAIALELKYATFYETDNSGVKTLALTEADGWSIYMAISIGTSSNAQVWNANISEGGGTSYHRFQMPSSTSVNIKWWLQGEAGYAAAIGATVGNFLNTGGFIGVRAHPTEDASIRSKRNDEGSVEADTDTDNCERFELQNLNNTGDGYKLKGHMAEAIFFDEALDATDNTAVESYLIAKYDI